MINPVRSALSDLVEAIEYISLMGAEGEEKLDFATQKLRDAFDEAKFVLSEQS